MPDRLSPLDVSFLYLEGPTSAMHVGSLMIFEEPAGGVDLPTLVEHVGARVAFVPRYRQKIRWVPMRLANPVWVDDESFDINAHIRTVTLPRPGTDQQLQELVARIQARKLDRSRPLWEMTVVRGLGGHRFAVATKVHQALVDGVRAVELGQVILDDDEQVREHIPQAWHPAPEPSLAELVAGAVTDSVRRPTRVIETVRAGLGDLTATAGKAAGALGIAARATRSAPRGPLNVEIGSKRLFQMVATDLADYRTIRNRSVLTGARSGSPGGTAEPPSPRTVVPTVNDVVLSVIAGALRAWLLARGHPVPPTGVVRALVPISVRLSEDGQGGALGSRVASLLIDLPTGEPSPLIRLHQVAYQTRAHQDAGVALDARAIAGLAGFAPPTLHSLGARVAADLSRHMFNLVITNVPGPQSTLYLAGSPMIAAFPVIPLAPGQALSIGLTSYDGGVYYGLNGDREAMADIAVLGQCLVDSLGETLDAVGSHRVSVRNRRRAGRRPR